VIKLAYMAGSRPGGNHGACLAPASVSRWQATCPAMPSSSDATTDHLTNQRVRPLTGCGPPQLRTRPGPRSWNRLRPQAPLGVPRTLAVRDEDRVAMGRGEIRR
jgi:hypothetical protein